MFASSNLCAHATTNPCYDHTTCQQDHSTGQATCSSCPPGYKGDGITCVLVQQDPCSPTSNPCHPGSTCYAVNGLATCGPCPKGMSGNGKVCHQPMSRVKKIFVGLDDDPCVPNPCYGDCFQGFLHGYKCAPCPQDMSGDGIICSPLNPCSSNPCHPDVACLAVTTREYKCLNSPCKPNPCHHGVQCLETGLEHFVCGPCPAGMTGDGVNCTKDPCDPNPCPAGVKCLDMAGGKYKCGDCPPGHTGNGNECIKNVEENKRNFLDPCWPNPCYPGVQCVAIWEGNKPKFSCGLCPDGNLTLY